MNTHTGSFQTADGLKIHTVQWLPTAPPKALVLLLHGISEHSGRYEHVAAALTQAGYGVYSLDHRGHGRSEGERIYFERIEQPIQDLQPYFEQISAAHPGQKIFIMGHSMGALLSLLFVLKHQARLAGWLASGLPINSDETFPAATLLMGRVLRHIVPRLRFGSLDISTTTRSPEVLEKRKNDPLVDDSPVRLGMGAAVILAGEQVRAHLEQVRLPLLLLHGGADAIAPASGSRLMYEKAASTDKTLKVYEGLYHEIFNEPEQDKVMGDVITWLDAHA